MDSSRDEPAAGATEGAAEETAAGAASVAAAVEDEISSVVVEVGASKGTTKKKPLEKPTVKLERKTEVMERGQESEEGDLDKETHTGMESKYHCQTLHGHNFSPKIRPHLSHLLRSGGCGYISQQRQCCEFLDGKGG